MPVLPLAPRTRARSAIVLLALAGACSTDVVQHSDVRHGRVRLEFAAPQAGAGQQINVVTALERVVLSYGLVENPDLQTQIVERVGPRFSELREDVVFDVSLRPGTYSFSAVAVSNTGDWLFSGSSPEPVVVSGGRFHVAITAAPIGAAMVIEPGTAGIQRNVSFPLLIRNSGVVPLRWRFVGMSPPCAGCLRVLPDSGTVFAGQPMTVSVVVFSSAPSGRSNLDFDQYVIATVIPGQPGTRVTGRVAVELDVR